MTRLLTIVSIAGLLLGAPLLAANNNVADAQADPTFYKEVLPILQDNCQVCHRANGANLGGMVAPMAFTSYNDTRPWAKSIAKQVEAKLMPPWHASEQQHGVFANERTLTDTEIDTIVRWAKVGAPAGSEADAPAPADFGVNTGWSIGEPDLVLDMGTDYLVTDDVEDHYITFVTEITTDMLPEPRWLKAIEFKPGSSVVHHIIAQPLGGIAPGNDPQIFNDGYGRLMSPGTKLRWQMHYHKEPGAGTAVMDRSSVALKFYPEGYEPEFAIQVEPLATMDFAIPAGDPNYSAVTSKTFDRDTKLVAYTPHMHVRGKAARYVAKYPNGTEEVLLEVPAYDFNWQTNYEYPAEGKVVPAGTEVELTMWWDNSADNPSNPDPTQVVTFGQPTTDEMMFGFVTYVDAEAGYRPPAGNDFFGGGNRRRDVDPEQMKKMLKERFGLDWDTMSDDERSEVLQRFQQGGAQSGQ